MFVVKLRGDQNDQMNETTHPEPQEKKNTKPIHLIKVNDTDDNLKLSKQPKSTISSHDLDL